MTGSDPSAVQALAASRVYRIQAAVRSLNADIRAALEGRSTWDPKFQFIARSWRHRDAPAHFNFTYYLAETFDITRKKEIAKHIHDSTQMWRAFLASFSVSNGSYEPHVRNAQKFVRCIINDTSYEPTPENLHHHLLQLMANLDVDNLIPGAIQEFHEDRDTDSGMMYLVESSGESQAPENGRFPIEQEGPTLLEEGALGIFWYLSSDWFQGKKAKQTPGNLPKLRISPISNSDHEVEIKIGDSMVWIPVYEEFRSDRFAGRFLGWLFGPGPKGSLTWHNVSRWLHACNAFARDLVHINTQALLTLRLKGKPDTKDPRKFLKRHLRDWEGWETVELLGKWERGGDDWCYFDTKTDQLKIRLDATPLDDAGAWGERRFENLRPIALKPGSNMARTTNWEIESLRQAQHLRTVARRLCRRITALTAAEQATTREQAAAWSHEVKNYGVCVEKPLFDYIEDHRSEADPRILHAHAGAAILTHVAAALHKLFDGNSLPSPDQADVACVLNYLLEHQQWELRRLCNVRLTYTCPKTTAPFEPNNITPEETRALLLLREVVQNIRNRSNHDIAICCVISADDSGVTASITQEQYEDESVAQDSTEENVPPGIRRAQSLFGDRGFSLGTIKSETPTRHDSERQCIIRNTTIRWG